MREVVQRAPTEHQVERRIEEWEPGRVALLEQHVGDVRMSQALGAEGQQLRGQVETNRLTHVWRHLLGDVGRAARDVQDDHLRVQRLEPCHRRSRPTSEERVVAGEQPDLTLERSTDNRVVLVGAHRPISTLRRHDGHRPTGQ